MIKIELGLIRVEVLMLVFVLGLWFVLLLWLGLWLVLDTLRMLSDEGMTMILVTHEIRFARDVSDRVAFFRDGVIHEIGSPQQVIDNPQRPETAAFLKSSH